MAIGDVLTILPSGLAGFAAPAAPSGLPTYLSITHTCPAGSPGAATTFDFDFAAYVDAILDVDARILATTKGGTAHLTGAVDFGSILAIEVRNGVAQLGAAASGGYKAIFQVSPDSIPILVGVNDTALLSGGFANMSAAWTFPGAGIARMTVTNQNATNSADVTVFLRVIVKVDL